MTAEPQKTENQDNGARAQAADDGSNGAQPQSQPQPDRAAELEAQVREEKNRYLYLYAEFENFKKRAVKDRSDAQKFGWENVARDLLQVLDNFDRAIAHMPPGTDKNLATGLQMIQQQFQATLERQGVQPVVSVGQPFDPNLHDAIAQEPSDQPEGTILQEHTRGYTLHGRLLRPARVVVSAGRA